MQIISERFNFSLTVDQPIFQSLFKDACALKIHDTFLSAAALSLYGHPVCFSILVKYDVRI